MDVVGLVPCAGYATRLGKLPFSKECLPIGFDERRKRVEVVAESVLRSMRRAGVSRVYCVLRRTKWDVADHLLGGEDLDVNVAYLVTEATPGVPHTIDRAYPFVRDSTVVFGFPDIVLRPETALAGVVDEHLRSTGDVCLGLFRPREPSQADMVEVDANGIVSRIHVKPSASSLPFAWAAAAWGPRFTNYVHEYINNTTAREAAKGTELQLGEVIMNAMDAGLRVTSHVVENGSFIDVGSPETFGTLLDSNLDTPRK